MFPFLKLQPKTKGVNHVAERGYHIHLQNSTHEMTHKKIKMKYFRCFLKQVLVGSRNGLQGDLQSHSCFFIIELK